MKKTQVLIVTVLTIVSCVTVFGKPSQASMDLPVVIIVKDVYNAYAPDALTGKVKSYTKKDVDRIIQSDPTNPLALFVAANRGDQALTKKLIDLGADPNKPTDFGHYAIHEAVARGHKSVVEVLIAAGAKVNVKVSPKGPRSPNQWTPLHYAANSGRIDLAQILISNGADATLQDLWGKTPVDYAREQKNTKMVKLLKATKK